MPALADSDTAVRPAASPAGRGCLWKRRDCYPPARLWYRLSLRFKGDFRWEGRADHPLSAWKVPADRVDSGLERWELESNTAVRLTLSCADVGELQREPFLVKRRINGKRRTIGGCPRNAPTRLKPTLNFAANATGELTFFSRTATMAAGTGNTHRCDGWSFSDIFTSSHGLVGSVGSRSSLTEGLELGWVPAPPTAGRLIHHDAVRCTPLGGGNPFLVLPEQNNERDDGFYAPALGTEYLNNVDPNIGWRPAPWFVRFAVRAAHFGGDFIIQGQAKQPQRDPRSPAYVRPPVAPTYEHWRKDYTYTLRLEPCPNTGLDVESC
jgi:hypothetical protein